MGGKARAAGKHKEIAKKAKATGYAEAVSAVFSLFDLGDHFRL